MTVPIIDWLIDTFCYTGLLIAAVLLARRPVSRHFGPQVAYALWALPLLRFAMPPLVLPAWMAPAQAPPAAPLPPAGEPMLIFAADLPPAAAAPVGLDPLGLLVALWLGGAALFLAWRARGYVDMRRALLAEARPVGEAGRVRLVETQAVAAPLAFGVFDKVVALPPRFMAHRDREARDLAIAHELAHHRGGDLLANIAAQPLLALHWFNPLAWAGWRAMRRDQEAACDARVIAGRGRTSRALYASVIAGFAAGDGPGGGQRALASLVAVPMACPVLGEKAIIHRLRSLASAEVPSHRRRSGLLAIGAAALGLPLTASISYAAPPPPTPPMPAAQWRAARAPLAPEPGLPIEVIHAHEHLGPGEPGDERHAGVRGPGGEAAILSRADHLQEQAERELEREEALAEQIEAQMEAREEAFAAMEEAFAERDEALERALEAAAEAREQALDRMQVAWRSVPQVATGLRCDGEEPVAERELAGGRRAIVICNEAIDARAIDGLKEARRAIERATGMMREDREEVLRQLDREIERLAGQRIAVSLRRELRQGAAPASPPQVSRIAHYIAARYTPAIPSRQGAPPAPPYAVSSAASAAAQEACATPTIA